MHELSQRQLHNCVASLGIADSSAGAFDVAAALPGLPVRARRIGIPEISEAEAVRYFTHLSRCNYGVDNGYYPLGSCTMKYSPKQHDAMADLDGFRYVHPAQPAESMQGLLELLHELQVDLAELTGMDAVSLLPAAGAHAELAGLFMIRRYLETTGDSRNIVLVADSAHGTNPASAAMAGFDVRIVPTLPDGLTDLAALRDVLSPEVAALMLTNPSTYGLFEQNVHQIATAVHDAGALFYCDGANFNALMGICRPGDLGFDLVHINAHKSLSTPHGGGGPGAGPLGVKGFLQEYLPVPRIVHGEDGNYTFMDQAPASIGRIKSGLGHVAVLLRAFQYIRVMGSDGLRKASEDAVLNANYLRHRLQGDFPAIFPGLCMHECLLSLEKAGLSGAEFSQRIVEAGFHPPTIMDAGCVYFGSGMAQAFLLEPTETESRQALDRMISVFSGLTGVRRTDHDVVSTRSGDQE